MVHFLSDLFSLKMLEDHYSLFIFFPSWISLLTIYSTSKISRSFMVFQNKTIIYSITVLLFPSSHLSFSKFWFPILKYAFCYECGIVFLKWEIHYLIHGEVERNSTLKNRGRGRHCPKKRIKLEAGLICYDNILN